MRILWIQKLIVLFGVFSLVACATASGVASGPNGKPIYFVEASTAELAFNKAGEKCPTGYSIVSNPTVNQYNNYIITVECK